MLRGIGYLLIITGALGVFAVLHAITYLLLGWPYVYGLSGLAYSGAFAACGMAAGVLLTRRKSVRRGPLFWIALLGICVCTPLALLHITRCAFYALGSRDLLSFVQLVLLGRADNDGWWPPQEVLFCNTLFFSPFGEAWMWYDRPLHTPTLLVCGPAQSLAFWIYLPLAVCLWAIWGRPGKWGNRLSALAPLLMALFLMTSVVETAWIHYQQATYEDTGLDALNYIYQPQLSWYAFYAIAMLSLVALAILLFRRKAHDATRGTVLDR